MPPKIDYTESSLTGKWKNSVTCKVVTKAEAQLTSANMAGGSTPSSTINPPGWWTGDCPAHHQRGHLIGNKLGGPGTEAKNLVTLTAGTNHPFMYEFEDCVYRCVSANVGKIYTYVVECDYSAYTEIKDLGIPGASGNPFCLFPAPAVITCKLTLSAKDLTLGELVKYLPNPPLDLGPAAAYTTLRIFNGGYKFFDSPRHYANSCWAVENTYANVQANAEAYAKHLGHLS